MESVHTMAALAVLAMIAPLSAVMGQEPAPERSGGERVLEKATFAGGCFWCVEPLFEKLDGVVSVTSGYTGGEKPNPTYEDVSTGETGHAEAVQIVFDPSRLKYAELLRIFWRNIDPTVEDRQFCDVGSQYRTAIFYHNEVQRRVALESKESGERKRPFREPIVTEITAAGEFYPAEEYHQNFHRKNPVRYNAYRLACGRDKRLKDLWGGESGH